VRDKYFAMTTLKKMIDSKSMKSCYLTDCIPYEVRPHLTVGSFCGCTYTSLKIQCLVVVAVSAAPVEAS
jgi:hypothetical protein